jgi:hypothetical protein
LLVLFWRVYASIRYVCLLFPFLLFPLIFLHLLRQRPSSSSAQ